MPAASSSTAGQIDHGLVGDVARGDEQAVGALYDRYGQAMYCTAKRILGEDADAEEAVLEAFDQVWRQASRFDPGRGSVASWLMMIVRSRALDMVRSRDRRERNTTSAARDEPDAAPAMGTWRTNPEADLHDSERRQQIMKALKALSPPQRQAIELAFYRGLSQSEIADELGEPLGTIKTRIRAGMQQLRETLRPLLSGWDHD